MNEKLFYFDNSTQIIVIHQRNRNQVTLDRNTFGFENTRDTVILINDIKIELLTDCVQALFVVCSQDLINAVCSQDFFNAVCSQDFIHAVY